MVMVVCVGVMQMGRQVEAGAVLCSYCQIAIQAIEGAYDWKNVSASEVENMLLPLCKNLSTFAKRAKCKGAINIGVPRILADLASNENPLALCGTLTLCDIKQSGNCVKCQAAVKGAEIELKKSNATDEEVIETFLPYCTKIFNQTEAELCKVGLQAAGPELIDSLRNGVNPLNFCGEFYICDISHPNPPPFGKDYFEDYEN